MEPRQEWSGIETAGWYILFTGCSPSIRAGPLPQAGGVGVALPEGETLHRLQNQRQVTGTGLPGMQVYREVRIRLHFFNLLPPFLLPSLPLLPPASLTFPPFLPPPSLPPPSHLPPSLTEFLLSPLPRADRVLPPHCSSGGPAGPECGRAGGRQ